MAETVGYLLDTNVLVALIRGNRLGQKIDTDYSLRANLNRSMISVVTVGEIYALGHKFGWGQKKLDTLQALLGELVWIDINRPEILQSYGEIDHASETMGRSMAKNDVWIAATARATGATLLTTDKDFDHLHGNHITRIWIDPELTKE